MFDITIISVGALKEDYWRSAVAEYEKRLRPFARLTIAEVSQTPFRSADDRRRVLAAEAEKILRRIPKNAIAVALAIDGKNVSTDEFAAYISQRGGGGAHLCFIIGGPLGLDPSVLAACADRISLSPLTFTHQIARILLLEQVYRAAAILSGKRYHY